MLFIQQINKSLPKLGLAMNSKNLEVCQGQSIWCQQKR